MLELRGITRRYGNFALNNLSFKVNRGEYFILLGRSGSGKSLTLELIAGIRKPEKAQVILNGTDIMKAGCGYWIRVSEDCTWTIEN